MAIPDGRERRDHQEHSRSSWTASASGARRTPLTTATKARTRWAHPGAGPGCGCRTCGGWAGRILGRPRRGPPGQLRPDARAVGRARTSPPATGSWPGRRRRGPFGVFERFPRELVQALIEARAAWSYRQLPRQRHADHPGPGRGAPPHRQADPLHLRRLGLPDRRARGGHPASRSSTRSAGSRASSADAYRVGRVIARPFIGRAGQLHRARRPPRLLHPAAAHRAPTPCAAPGVPVKTVGKIDDLFAGRGITEPHATGDQRRRDARRHRDGLAPPPTAAWSSPTSSTSTCSTATAATPTGYAARAGGVRRTGWRGFLPRAARRATC